MWPKFVLIILYKKKKLHINLGIDTNTEGMANNKSVN